MECVIKGTSTTATRVPSVLKDLQNKVFFEAALKTEAWTGEKGVIFIVQFNYIII